MDYWKEGNRAFAYRDEDEYFYPATIVEFEDEDIRVRFDTGEEEWTDSEYLEEYRVEVDEEVECKSTQDNLYYDAIIIAVDGERVQVEYEDAATEWTALNRIRFYIE